MLRSILNKQTCAECRFCCSFRRVSLWEAPFILPEVAELKADKDKFEEVSVNGQKCYRMKLENKYKTEDENEEAPCEFLNPDIGCVLDDESKPFDCKLWPIRIMEKSNKYVIALTPTCPSVNKVPMTEIKKLVNEKLSKEIKNYIKKNKFIIKEYVEGFPIIEEFDKF